MSGQFPEHPVLFYPSLAQRYGAEEAILLSIYQDFARHHGAVDGDQQMYFLARRIEWQKLTPFWSEEQLATLTNSLVSQGAIDAEFNANGSIRILMLNGERRQTAEVRAIEAGINEISDAGESKHEVLSRPESQSAVAEVVVQDAVAEPPVHSKAYQAVTEMHQTSATMLSRGPAPSFGGSTGWDRPKDDLQCLFDQQEKRNQQLHEIDLGWKPSTTTYQMLAKHNITTEFADGLIDEFIAYWLAKNKKKSSWDPHFIDHVKRKWVREQSRQGRRTFDAKTDQKFEGNGERYQSTNRAEKRERITSAVMDINNIDW